MVDFKKATDKAKLQKAEFDALDKLIHATQSLPAACKANGRTM